MHSTDMSGGHRHGCHGKPVLPVVDLRLFKDPSTRGAFVIELRNALTEHGFFYLVGTQSIHSAFMNNTARSTPAPIATERL